MTTFLPQDNVSDSISMLMKIKALLFSCQHCIYPDDQSVVWQNLLKGEESTLKVVDGWGWVKFMLFLRIDKKWGITLNWNICA